MAEDDVIGDGYNTTVVLDCGCHFRLNIQGRMPRPKVGWFYSCLSGHSMVSEYDRLSGQAEFDRDRKAVEVRDES